MEIRRREGVTVTKISVRNFSRRSSASKASSVVNYDDEDSHLNVVKFDTLKKQNIYTSIFINRLRYERTKESLKQSKESGKNSPFPCFYTD